MSKPVLFIALRRVLPFAAIFIATIFSLSVLTIQGNDDSQCYPRSQYFSSEDQDNDLGCGDDGPCSVINSALLADIPGPEHLASYLSEREVELSLQATIISLLFNRAPPH